MAYFKKSKKSKITDPDFFTFDGNVIFENYEKGEKMKNRKNAFKGISVFAVLTFTAAVIFLICGKAGKHGA